MPILLKSFQCIITDIEYKVVPDVLIKNKMRYVVDMTVREKGTGMLRSKSVYPALVFLSKESWEHKIFEVGDIIQFAENTKWKSTPYTYIINDTKYVAKTDKSKIKIFKGKPSVPITIYNFQLRAKEEQVKIILKNEDFIYCTIPKSRIRFPLTSKADFYQKELKYIITPEEYTTLFKLRDKLVEVILYEMKRNRAKRIMKVTLNPFDEISKYQLILSDVPSGENNDK